MLTNLKPPYQIRSYNDDLFRLSTCYESSLTWDKDTSVIRDLAKNISRKAFDNVDDYQYVYFSSGVTDALNVLIPKKNINIYQNEYRYLNLFNNVTVTNEYNDIDYLSYPYAGNGKFLKIPTNKPLLLDCSYIFASNMSHDRIIPDNVHTVLFGLSKSHNLADYRIGWILSKNKIPEYHILQYEFNYAINGNIPVILNNVLNHDGNWLYKKYKDNISTLYSKNNVTEHDTNLFGIKNGIKIPWYLL